MAGAVVQSSTKVNFGGASTTLNLSLTGVAAGNSIIVTVSAYNAATAANITASDGTAYSVVEGTQAGGGTGATATILYRHNVSSGNYTITVTTNAAGGNRYGWARAMEVSGLVNAAPNARMPAANGANGGTSNSPSTGSSSATSVANCFVVAALSVSGGGSDAGIDTPATTGYTNHWIDQDFNTEEAGSADYKSVTSTGAQSAAWGTLTGSYLWSASLAAFEETGGGGDTTAPTLTSPTGTATGSTTASGTVSTDEANGTAYAVVTVSGTAPTAAQVRAGQDNSGAAAAWSGSQAVTTTGTKTFNATGLTASTAYYFHFHHRDAANNDSTVVSSAQFTTTAGASIIKQMLMQHGG